MQVHKLHEQQDIKPNMKQTSADAKIAALKAKLGVSSQPKEGNVNEKMWGRNRGNPVVTHQALGTKHKEPS